MKSLTCKYFIAIIIVAFALQQVYSQRFQDMEGSFPFTSIQDIQEDKYGHMWFASRNGLVSYNGYRFEHFRPGNEPGQCQGSYIQCIYPDSSGNIWLGSRFQTGLELYNRSLQRFSQYCIYDTENDRCFESIDLYSIDMDQDGFLWIGTDKGVFNFDPETDDTIKTRFIYDAHNEYSLLGKHAWKIYVDQNNNVWVGTLQGLNRFDRESQRFINSRTNPNYLTGQILTIRETPSNELWMSGRVTEDRIYRYSVGTDSFEPIYSFPKGLGNYFNFDFKDDGTCWIASRGIGSLSFDPQELKIELFDGHDGSVHGLTEYRNQIIFVDQFQNVWIGGTQLFKLPSSEKSIFNIKGNGYLVLAIHEEPDYIIYSLNEPYVWHKETKKTTPFWTFGESQNIRPQVQRASLPKLIYEYKKRDKNTLIFTTVRSVYTYDLRTKKAKQYPQNLGGSFLDFEFGKKHDLFISEGNSYPITFDFESGKAGHAKEEPLSQALYATSISKDSNGNYWWGTKTGGLIHRYNEDREILETYPLEVFKHGKKIRAGQSFDILEHSDGTIWVATEVGLLRFNGDHLFDKLLNKSDGLSSEYILSLEEDLNGNLWMGTASGLSCLQVPGETIRNFSQQDGLINQRYGWGASTKGIDGTLYFGGANGIDYFHPEQMGYNDIPPEIFIDQILINGKRYLTGKAIEIMRNMTLPHTQNFIDIDLLAMHLTAPEGNQYAYRINDRPWIQSGTNRRISLANTAPGTYRIYAKASNADNVWSEQRELLSIHIQPPWWRTPWFYALLVLGTLFIIYLIYQYRINEIKKQEAKQTAFDKKIAEIEMKALRAQMNPHFLFNSLNSVKSLISKGENVPATAYLTRFSQLIRQVLNNSRKKFIRLNDELNALRLYLELEAMRFADSFEYEICVGENVNPDFLEIPPMILQPFVENAIWHGLMHKLKGPRKVLISIERKEDLVLMQVEDNGIGRKAARDLQTRSKSKQESLGIQITQDRLQLIRDLYGTSAEISIEDMYGQDQNPKGTRVRITLPIPE